MQFNELTTAHEGKEFRATYYGQNIGKMIITNVSTRGTVNLCHSSDTLRGNKCTISGFKEKYKYEDSIGIRSVAGDNLVLYPLITSIEVW